MILDLKAWAMLRIGYEITTLLEVLLSQKCCFRMCKMLSLNLSIHKWVLNGYFFFQLSHFSQVIKHLISTQWLANSNRRCSHFPHNFWTSYNYLIHPQSETSPVIKWS